MTNTLVDPADLAGLPGAPFTDLEVDVAVASIRRDAGWHIAPQMAETDIPLDVAPFDPVLRLPTRRLVSVEAVRDADSGDVFDPSRYRVSRERARIRRKGGYWPHGYERVEVDMTHGYEQCPADLLPVIAQYALGARRDYSVQSVRVDDSSVSYATAGTETLNATLAGNAALARYTLPEFPGMA